MPGAGHGGRGDRLTDNSRRWIHSRSGARHGAHRNAGEANPSRGLASHRYPGDVVSAPLRAMRSPASTATSATDSQLTPPLGPCGVPSARLLAIRLDITRPASENVLYVGLDTSAPRRIGRYARRVRCLARCRWQHQGPSSVTERDHLAFARHTSVSRPKRRGPAARAIRDGTTLTAWANAAPHVAERYRRRSSDGSIATAASFAQATATHPATGMLLPCRLKRSIGSVTPNGPQPATDGRRCDREMPFELALAAISPPTSWPRRCGRDREGVVRYRDHLDPDQPNAGQETSVDQVGANGT